MSKPITIRIKSVEQSLLEKLAKDHHVTKTDVIHAAIFAMAKAKYDPEVINEIVASNYYNK